MHILGIWLISYRLWSLKWELKRKILSGMSPMASMVKLQLHFMIKHGWRTWSTNVMMKKLIQVSFVLMGKLINTY